MPQQARSHARRRFVQRREQRRGPAPAGVLRKNRRHQFQVANRYGVQHQSIGLLVIPDAVQMPQRRFQVIAVLRSLARSFAQVMHHGAGGGDGLRMPCEAKAVEGRYAELLAQHPLGIVRAKDPLFNACFDTLAQFAACPGRVAGALRVTRGCGKQSRLPREQNFARLQAVQFVAQFFIGVGAGELRH